MKRNLTPTRVTVLEKTYTIERDSIGSGYEIVDDIKVDISTLDYATITFIGKHRKLHTIITKMCNVVLTIIE